MQDYWKGRARKRGVLARRAGNDDADTEQEDGVTDDEVEGLSQGIVELGRETSKSSPSPAASEHVSEQEETNKEHEKERRGMTTAEKDEDEGRVVDVVLSDMSAPWEQINGTWIRSVNNPYRRMMNTSGMPFRDHAGSMVRFDRHVRKQLENTDTSEIQDLCNAALTFCYSTLCTGGHFLCKFYQGGEDKAFELRLRKLFEKVHREKPESSRPVSFLLSSVSLPFFSLCSSLHHLFRSRPQ